MSPPFILRWISQARHPSCTSSVSHFVGRRESLGACGEMVWPRMMACEIPELNFYWGVFWPAFIYAYQIFWGLILHLSQLSSVTDFSGISQCANQQEEGRQNWTSNDQGQLHLRSLILCSLSSAPLLITARVFPVEWKGATVGLENDTCVDSQSKCVIYGKSVVLNAKRILWWELLSFVVVDLFSTTYLIIYYPH